MKTIRIIFAPLIILAFLVSAQPAVAKFNCKVEKVGRTTLTLKNCEQKGLEKLSPGDTVSITKKRKTQSKKKKSTKSKKKTTSSKKKKK